MRRRTLLAGVGAAAAAGIGAGTAALAGMGAGRTATPVPSTAVPDVSTTIDPRRDWGVWQGWGTSLCWWANAFGNRDDLADVFFTTGMAPYQNQRLPGLGLNIVRYNAGASTSHMVNGKYVWYSATDPPFKRMEGFWLDGYSTDPDSASWNWSADPEQRAMLVKARDRGVDRFELFSNSPLWWMCVDYTPEGFREPNDRGRNGGNNLQPGRYRQHAMYLATIARYARDHWGVDFQSVEAFNEPSARWWQPYDPQTRSYGKQEGCHFDLPTQQTILGYLRSELDARGLHDTAVAASDENTYDEARRTWEGLGDAQRFVGKINTHGYQYGGGRRDLLYNAAQRTGRNLWNSEYGDSDPSGIMLATNLLLDFESLHPTAWVYWQAVDGERWGFIRGYGDGNPPTTTTVNQKYYVLAQFTRHIRPGQHILGSGKSTVAAYDPGRRTLSIVALNPGNDQSLGFDLSRFRTAGGDNGLVHRWMTGGGEQYRYHDDTFLQGHYFQSSFPSKTVQTFEINNVVW